MVESLDCRIVGTKSLKFTVVWAESVESCTDNTCEGLNFKLSYIETLLFSFLLQPLLNKLTNLLFSFIK